VTDRNSTLVAWLPALVYMAVIWALSSLQQPPSLAGVPFQDKGAHFAEYAGLGGLLFHAFAGTWRGARDVTLLAAAAFCASFWGLIDEIHQAYVPNRVADPKDLAADAVGALIGCVLYFIARACLRRLRP
jgi:VanZ family protein